LHKMNAVFPAGQLARCLSAGMERNSRQGIERVAGVPSVLKLWGNIVWGMELFSQWGYINPVNPTVMTLAILLAAGSAAVAEEVTPTPDAQGSAASGGQSADVTSPDTSKIILAAKPADGGPAQGGGLKQSERRDSAMLAGALATDGPKYNPVPVPQATANGNPELSDSDKPKNTIPRLPLSTMSRYMVHGTRPPQFRDRDLYTRAGLIDIAMKAHPGLSVGNIFNLNAAAAYEMFLEQERLSKMGDLEETAEAMAIGGDPAEAKLIQDATAEAFIRDEDNSGPVHMR
jgi:hypothetical protein